VLRVGGKTPTCPEGIQSDSIAHACHVYIGGWEGKREGR
jgi:hypothetical protein